MFLPGISSITLSSAIQATREGWSGLGRLYLSSSYVQGRQKIWHVWRASQAAYQVLSPQIANFEFLMSR